MTAMLAIGDLVAIGDLLTDLWFDVDHHDGVGVAELFVPEGSLTFDRATFTGQDEIRQVYRDRAAAGTRISRHVLTNLRVRTHGHDSAAVYSLMTLYADDGAFPSTAVTPVSVADVFDVVARTTGGWAFRSRSLQTLFRDPGARLAVPTE